jgi:hypothetical protein
MTFVWLGFFGSFSASVSDSDLPTRVPTITPTPVVSTTPTTLVPAEGAGGLIILQAEATPLTPDGLWTQVQWQDHEGNWHDVEGWQGAFNHKFEVIWWVAAENLGQRPFHWLVYENQESERLLGISDPFALPDHNKAVVYVVVTLP